MRGKSVYLAFLATLIVCSTFITHQFMHRAEMVESPYFRERQSPPFLIRTFGYAGDKALPTSALRFTSLGEPSAASGAKAAAPAKAKGPPQVQGGFPLAEGVLQGAVEEGYYYGRGYGLGLPDRADKDPITGRPLLAEHPDYPLTRARLTPSARTRQRAYDDRTPDDSIHAAAVAAAASGGQSGRTTDPLPAAGRDWGAYKLGRLGVAV